MGHPHVLSWATEYCASDRAHVPKGWPAHLPSGTPPACLLETCSLTIFQLGWVTTAWRTQVCPRKPAWPEQVGGEGWGERERVWFPLFPQA